jgi:hypothetical protein
MFSCGPLPPISNLVEWRAARAKHFWDLVGMPEPEGQSSGSTQDIIARLDRIRAAEIVTVWIGAGLPDRLMLAFLVQLADLGHLDERRLRVVDFAKLGIDAINVGYLSPEVIAANRREEQLGDAELARLREAWNAITASDPEALLRFVADDRDEPLDRAVRRLLSRFPDEQTGLSEFQHSLLRNVAAHGPRMSHAIGYAHEDRGYDPDWLGYSEGTYQLRRLGHPRLPAPLVTITPPTDPDVDYEIRVLPDGSEVIHPDTHAIVRLTPAGEDVLAGRRNHLDLNGIDDWIGGIHLPSSTGTIWVRSGQSLIERRVGVA